MISEEVELLANHLQDIKSAIYYLTAFLAGIFIFLVILIRLFIVRIARDKNIQVNSFDSVLAEQMYLKGDNEKLKDYCEDFLFESPNDCRVTWYLALSHYGAGNLNDAVDYFKKTSVINPSYRESCEPYLQEIYNLSEESEISH